MKESWKEYKLDELLKIYNGKDHKFLKDGNIPVYGSGGIMRYVDKYLYDGDSILLPRKGTLDNIMFVKGKIWTVDTMYYSSVNLDLTDPYFLCSYLQQLKLEQLDTGSALPSMTQTIYYSVKVTLPSLSIQKRIASILSAYDDLIEVNNQRIELLEQSARELYKEWFVRMRFPNYQHTKFNKGIPEGWEIKKLGEIVDITSSKRIFLSEYTNEGIPFYRGKEISMLSRGESINDILYISNKRYEDIKSKFGVPKEGDILITAVGTIGNTYRVDNHKFYFKDGNLIWLRIENENLSSFLHLLLSSQFISDLLDSFSIGSSQSALTIDILKKVALLQPKEDILINFSRMSKPIYNQIETIQKQNQELTEIRNRLLPRLISGKLEVKA